jgi:hypothetical protein
MRIPLPLLLAAAVGVGTVVTLIIQVSLVVLGSWDVRYAAFNGTHVVSTTLLPSWKYRFIYSGTGTAYFGDTVNVYYLNIIRDTSYVRDYDLGKYLPMRVVVVSGSLPTNVYIQWTDPYGGRVRKIYFDGSSDVAYVMGTYTTGAGTAGAVIPVRYVADGNQYILYPLDKASITSPGTACNILKNAGFGTATNLVFAVPDSQYYDCSLNSWSSTTIRWGAVATGATQAELVPPPGTSYYKVTYSDSTGTIDIYLGYWWFIDSDPGWFAVKPR